MKSCSPPADASSFIPAGTGVRSQAAWKLSSAPLPPLDTTMELVGRIVAFARGNQQASSVSPGDLARGDALGLVLEDLAIHRHSIAVQDTRRRHVARIARERARSIRRVIAAARMRGYRVEGRFLRFYKEERESRFDGQPTYFSLTVELEVLFLHSDRDAAIEVLTRAAAANDFEFEVIETE